MNEHEHFCATFYLHMYHNPYDDQSAVWESMETKYMCPYSTTVAMLQMSIDSEAEIRAIYWARLLQLDKAQCLRINLSATSRRQR